VAVPSLEAPPVPPPVPVVPLVEVPVVPVLVELVPVDAVAPVVPVVPVEPVPLGVAVATADGVGVAVAVPVAPELVSELPDAPAALGAAPFGIVTVAGGPGTSGAIGSPPPQPASTTVPSSRASRLRRVPTALSAEGRTSGGRMWGSR
jgi:hypothetical protein